MRPRTCARADGKRRAWPDATTPKPVVGRCQCVRNGHPPPPSPGPCSFYLQTLQPPHRTNQQPTSRNRQTPTSRKIPQTGDRRHVAAPSASFLGLLTWLRALPIGLEASASLALFSSWLLLVRCWLFFLCAATTIAAPPPAIHACTTVRSRRRSRVPTQGAIALHHKTAARSKKAAKAATQSSEPASTFADRRRRCALVRARTRADRAPPSRDPLYLAPRHAPHFVAPIAPQTQEALKLECLDATARPRLHRSRIRRRCQCRSGLPTGPNGC